MRSVSCPSPRKSPRSPRAAYRDGRTFGEAFAALVGSLLGELQSAAARSARSGHSRAGRAAARAGRRCCAGSPCGARRAAAANSRRPAITRKCIVDANNAPFFLFDGDRRLALRREGGAYASRDARYTASELRDLSARLSPNALLRPVVADYLMPTVATVLGPGRNGLHGAVAGALSRPARTRARDGAARRVSRCWTSAPRS